MELIDNSVSARSLLSGATGFDVTAGKTLNIETSPGGSEILEVTVPIGQTWHVQLSVQIEKFTDT